MPKLIFLNWYTRFQNEVLSAIDNTIATPFNNEQVIWDLKYQEPCPGPDVEHPYPSVNGSAQAPLLKGSVAFLALFGIFFSLFVTFYRKIRTQENRSHYHFFAQLQRDEFEKLTLQNRKVNATLTPFEHLHAVAYFYNPDISPLVLCLRRTWAFLRGDPHFERLQSYLKTRIASKPRIKRPLKKEIVLRELYEEISGKLALFITSKKNYGEWGATKQKNGRWIVRPAPQSDELQAWLAKNKPMQSEKSDVAIKKKKANVWQSILSFIEVRLQELGAASFVYWIGVFTFYFLPGIGIVSGAVLPPIVIACGFLLAVWCTKAYRARLSNLQELDIANNNEEQDSGAFFELIKQRMRLDQLLTQEASESVNDLPMKSIKKVKYRDSRVCKELKAVLKKKHDFRFVWTIFNGFVGGCFTIFFSFWLLTATLGLFLTLNPVIVLGVTLGIGLIYGLYTAVTQYKNAMHELKDEKAKYKKVKIKYAEVEEKYENSEFPDLSLREYDRLFRCGELNSTTWTLVKQICNRAWVAFIRFGTGFLFFRLLPLATTATVLTALGIMAAPAFLPTLIVLCAGGLFFAAWHMWQYHYMSHAARASNVMHVLLNLPEKVAPPPIIEESVVDRNAENKTPAHPGIGNRLALDNGRASELASVHPAPATSSYVAKKKLNRSTRQHASERMRRLSRSDSNVSALLADAKYNTLMPTFMGKKKSFSRSTTNLESFYNSRDRSNSLPPLILPSEHRRSSRCF